MSFLTRFLAPLGHISHLLEEQNSLLRELIQAQGHPAVTRRTAAPMTLGRVRTDKDVSVVTRETLLAQDTQRRAAQAPWRTTPENGLDSGSGPMLGNEVVPLNMPVEMTPSPAKP